MAGFRHYFTEANIPSLDFVSDLPMDVPPIFYPPPTVWVPQIEIPPLKKYEYKFEREKAAIFRWEKELRNRRNDEGMQMQRQRSIDEKGTEDEGEFDGRSCSGIGEEMRQRRTEEGKELDSFQQPSVECLRLHSHLMPSHNISSLPPLLKAVPTSTGSASTSNIGTTPNKNDIVLQKSYSTNNTLDGLEEFEPRRDLFDLMELRSLDTRKELEKFFDL